MVLDGAHENVNACKQCDGESGCPFIGRDRTIRVGMKRSCPGEDGEQKGYDANEAFMKRVIALFPKHLRVTSLRYISPPGRSVKMPQALEEPNTEEI